MVSGMKVIVIDNRIFSLFVVILKLSLFEYIYIFLFNTQDDLLVGASTWHRFKTNRRFLKIKSVDIGDSGVFVCKGVNGFGSVSVQIQLVVRGKYRFSN